MSFANNLYITFPDRFGLRSAGGDLHDGGGSSSTVFLATGAFAGEEARRFEHLLAICEGCLRRDKAERWGLVRVAAELRKFDEGDHSTQPGWLMCTGLVPAANSSRALLVAPAVEVGPIGAAGQEELSLLCPAEDFSREGDRPPVGTNPGGGMMNLDAQKHTTSKTTNQRGMIRRAPAEEGINKASRRSGGFVERLRRVPWFVWAGIAAVGVVLVLISAVVLVGRSRSSQKDERETIAGGEFGSQSWFAEAVHPTSAYNTIPVPQPVFLSPVSVSDSTTTPGGAQISLSSSTKTETHQTSPSTKGGIVISTSSVNGRTTTGGTTPGVARVKPPGPSAHPEPTSGRCDPPAASPSQQLSGAVILPSTSGGGRRSCTPTDAMVTSYYPGLAKTVGGTGVGVTPRPMIPAPAAAPAAAGMTPPSVAGATAATPSSVAGVTPPKAPNAAGTGVGVTPGNSTPAAPAPKAAGTGVGVTSPPGGVTTTPAAAAPTPTGSTPPPVAGTTTTVPMTYDANFNPVPTDRAQGFDHLTNPSTIRLNKKWMNGRWL